MKREQIQDMAYMAIYAALYIVLWYVGKMVPFLTMPQGGSIQIEVAPLFIASFHLGWHKGFLVALLCWVLELLMGGSRWFLNVPQYLFDYIIPLIVIGVASIFKGKYRIYIGVVVAMVLRFLSTVISGVYYWPPEDMVAGSSAAWVYSLSYNVWYNAATLIVCIILVPLLAKHLKKMMHVDFE